MFKEKLENECELFKYLEITFFSLKQIRLVKLSKRGEKNVLELYRSCSSLIYI